MARKATKEDILRRVNVLVAACINEAGMETDVVLRAAKKTNKDISKNTRNQ